MIIKSLINHLKYSRNIKKMKKLPIEKQIAIGKETYSYIYNLCKECSSVGNNKAISSVIFDCKYPGHVSYIENFVRSKISSNKDPLCFYNLEEIYNNSYILTTGVMVDDPGTAELLADSSCMLSIYQVTTVRGNFRRLRSTVEDNIGFDNMTKILKSILTSD